ncbi:hypothetical protein EON66_09190, partial [archaeon]
MTEVTLHLYDLSMGMARTMSPLFIGKLIEFIPHTGVVVFGHEYFFSGGIQVRASRHRLQRARICSPFTAACAPRVAHPARARVCGRVRMPPASCTCCHMQVLPPHRVVEFSGLPPIERIPMGHTTKTEAELREFLRSVSHR